MFSSNNLKFLKIGDLPQARACGMRIRAKASIKVPSVKMLFDFHKLHSSLFERTASLGSSIRNAEGTKSTKVDEIPLG